MHGVYRYSLRRAGPADEQALSALLKACYSELAAEFYDADILEKALPVMTAANPQLLRSGNSWVAETPEEMTVGCGGWSLEWPGTGEIVPGEAHIRQYAVHPGWSRRGITSTVNRQCFTSAAGQGIELIHCYAALGSEPFYEALGFDTIRSMVLELPNEVLIPVTHVCCRVDALLNASN